MDEERMRYLKHFIELPYAELASQKLYQSRMAAGTAMDYLDWAIKSKVEG